MVEEEEKKEEEEGEGEGAMYALASQGQVMARGSYVFTSFNPPNNPGM